MTFVGKFVQPPDALRADVFLLRPIRATDAQLDFEAVIESRDYLRTWEQTGWPEDDFTVEENRVDLARMERRHCDREAFTYTMMDTSESECLGCVYIFTCDAEMFARAEISPISNEEWSDYEAAIYFWVRKSRLNQHLDRSLLNALGPWFEREWQFNQWLFVTSEAFEQQVTMFESAQLQVRFRITDLKAAGDSLAFA